MTKEQKPRRGGRPSKEEAGKLEDKILDAAAALFFSEGYGAVSIEEVARRAQISKRTFYARFENKAALFRAVVHRVIGTLRPTDSGIDRLFEGKNIEEILQRIAPVILHASLSPDGLALHRVMMAEATRFPELALIMNEQNTRQEAIRRLAALLQRETNPPFPVDPTFAAEQFLFLLSGAPQRRALGLGTPMTVAELDQWTKDTVSLFLKGWQGCLKK